MGCVLSGFCDWAQSRRLTLRGQPLRAHEQGREVRESSPSVREGGLQAPRSPRGSAQLPLERSEWGLPLWRGYGPWALPELAPGHPSLCASLARSSFPCTLLVLARFPRLAPQGIRLTGASHCLARSQGRRRGGGGCPVRGPRGAPAVENPRGRISTPGPLPAPILGGAFPGLLPLWSTLALYVVGRRRGGEKGCLNPSACSQKQALPFPGMGDCLPDPLTPRKLLPKRTAGPERGGGSSGLGPGRHRPAKRRRDVSSECASIQRRSAQVGAQWRTGIPDLSNSGEGLRPVPGLGEGGGNLLLQLLPEEQFLPTVQDTSPAVFDVSWGSMLLRKNCCAGVPGAAS